MTLKRILISAAAGLVLAAPAWADPHDMGPGMMGGGDACLGMHGMGDMMGGEGMHRGMMGGDGMGPGMMGGRGAAGLDLTAEQRAKIAAIHRDFRRWQWESMEKMHELNWRSEEARRAGTFDEQAERRAYEQAAAVRRQMFENQLEARKRFDAVLTPQQREQMKQRGWRR